MSVIIFIGPSLDIQRARTVLDADYRPPVERGDVLRALDENPVAIGSPGVVWAGGKGITNGYIGQREMSTKWRYDKFTNDGCVPSMDGGVQLTCEIDL